MFGLLVYACAPTPIVVDDSPSSTVDSPTYPSDTDSGEVTEPTETITGTPPPPEPPSAELVPSGGTFIDPVVVDLELKEGESAFYTLDGSLPTTAATAWTGPITLERSTELRVLLQNELGMVDYAAESYLALGGELEDFSSNLPLLVAWTQGDIDDAEYGYQNVAFSVFEPGKDGRARLLGAASLTTRAALRERGSSTAYDPKHSYALELRESGSDDDGDEALVGLPAESDWVLYAPLGFDRALMRNALMFRLSNDTGHYAPRTRFVELFTVSSGGTLRRTDYQGVYTLMEAIKRSPERVDIEELAPAHVNEPEVTGGYLFKRDRVGAGESGSWAGSGGGAFSFGDPLVFVDPEEDVIARAQERYFEETIDNFALALASPDHRFEGVHYRDQIDVAVWIDNHILNMYPKNVDALRLSAYMYKDREGPIVAGPLWDFDRSMGCADDSRPEDPTWWDATNITSDTTPMFTYGWYAGLFADPEFSALYWARLEEMLEGTLAIDHVLGVVQEMEAELSEAAPRNFETWSDYGPRGGSYAAEVDLLEAWLTARDAWIKGCLERPDPLTCQGG